MRRRARFPAGLVALLSLLFCGVARADSLATVTGTLHWDTFTASGIDLEWIEPGSSSDTFGFHSAPGMPLYVFMAHDGKTGWVDTHVRKTDGFVLGEATTTAELIRAEAIAHVVVPGSHAESDAGAERHAALRALSTGTLTLRINYTMDMFLRTTQEHDWAYAVYSAELILVNSISGIDWIDHQDVLFDKYVKDGQSFGPITPSGSLEVSVPFVEGDVGGFTLTVGVYAEATTPEPPLYVLLGCALLVFIMHARGVTTVFSRAAGRSTCGRPTR